MGNFVREKVAFKSIGDECVAWYYRPEKTPKGGLAAIAMAHGLAAVKEMYDLPAFAEKFATAGFAVLLFDYRYWGESGGEPRGQIFPTEQIEDYRNALTSLSERPEIDASRLAVWGTSFSGGHVLHLGAYDPRVKCVVSQVPAVDMLETLQRNMTPESLSGFKEQIVADRLQRYQTGETASILINAPAGEPCLIPGEEAYRRVQRELEFVPTLNRKCTLSSFEKLFEHYPASAASRISPVPLLMVVAGNDDLTPPDIALRAYAQALEPKSLLYLQCEHYDVYKRVSPETFERASAAAVEWFSKHL